MPVPEDNPLTAEKIELGRRFFFDRRLSRDQSISCASCHDPDRAFSDGRARRDRHLGRSRPPQRPGAHQPRLRPRVLLGRPVATLEEQVLKPIQDPNEMDLTLAEASRRVRSAPDEISTRARQLRPLDPLRRLALRPLHQRRRRRSPTEQQAGLQVFRGKGNCTACHVGPNFTDERLHNTGVAWRDGRLADDRGRAVDGAFKTPTLREIARTAPYMHDGSLATLEDVVDHYDRGGRPNPFLDLKSAACVDARRKARAGYLSGRARRNDGPVTPATRAQSLNTRSRGRVRPGSSVVVRTSLFWRVNFVRTAEHAALAAVDAYHVDVGVCTNYGSLRRVRKAAV